MGGSAIELLDARTVGATLGRLHDTDRVKTAKHRTGIDVPTTGTRASARGGVPVRRHPREQDS